MNDNSNKDLLASLNVNRACVQPTVINPNHFDQELLASLNLNPACLKPTDVVKITPVLIDGDVFYHAQLANGSLIVTSQANTAISLNTDNLPTIPSNPYDVWPSQGAINEDNDIPGTGISGTEYTYLPFFQTTTSTPGRAYWGSAPNGVNPIYKGYGPMQLFRPDFTMIREHDDAYTPNVNPGDLIGYIGLMVPFNPLSQGLKSIKTPIWRLQPDNSLYNKNQAAQWRHPVSFGISSSELNIMALNMGTRIFADSPATTFDRLKAAIESQFADTITTANTREKDFNYTKPGPNYPYNDYRIGVYQLQPLYRSLNLLAGIAAEEWSKYTFGDYISDIANNPNNVKIPEVLVSLPSPYYYKSESLWATSTPGSQSRVTDNSQYNSQTF
ncbi:hypothetical protein ACQKIW_29200 [Bacillus thuringiensis]|uniref:hypothetical protein n=1 Tax=Bacillus thuringiensis TaxID=1428 RepID=UPI003D04CBA1